MPAWPSTLPQSALLDGASGSFGVYGMRTQTQAGPAKQRRAFTAAPRPRRVGFEMTRAELGIFEAFWRDDTAGGVALVTAFPDPIDGPTTVRFDPTKPPTWAPRDDPAALQV
jgi:hypothetical protein